MLVMAKRKKRLVKTEDETDKETELYAQLVEIIRRSRGKKKINDAFNQIVEKLDPRIKQIAYKFEIPGFSYSDVYQEALYALRYKAIKDYDPDRSSIKKVSPFDKFAVLCIRRHLSTKRKSAYQSGKNKILNYSISLDQNRNNTQTDEELFLSGIIADESSDAFLKLNDKDYRDKLFLLLYNRLSRLERKILILYCRKYTYEEIVYLINNSSNKYNIETKSVDNALSRIKAKAKEIFKKHGE